MKSLLTTLFCLLLFQSTRGQDGKLEVKKRVELQKTPIWNKIAVNDTLLPEYRHLELLEFYLISYWSDSLLVNGILVEPKKAGKYPVVIFNRGGNRDFSRLSVGMLLQSTSRLAAAGYVVIGSNYRKADEFGGAEINDMLNLLGTIRELAKADTTRVGMYGWSRGGMMTYLALQKSTRIKTAVVGNGATDLFGVIADRPKMETEVMAECIPHYWENKIAALQQRSVVYWADQLNRNSSLLLLCGTYDKHVNPGQARVLAKKLAQLNYKYEFHEFETDHFFSDKKAELDALVIQWFQREL